MNDDAITYNSLLMVELLELGAVEAAELKGFDAIIPRIGASVTFFGTAVVANASSRRSRN